MESYTQRFGIHVDLPDQPLVHEQLERVVDRRLGDVARAFAQGAQDLLRRDVPRRGQQHFCNANALGRGTNTVLFEDRPGLRGAVPAMRIRLTWAANYTSAGASASISARIRLEFVLTPPPVPPCPRAPDGRERERAMERPRGFTLPELVFTMAIVVGLLGWAVPTLPRHSSETPPAPARSTSSSRPSTWPAARPSSATAW